MTNRPGDGNDLSGEQSWCRAGEQQAAAAVEEEEEKVEEQKGQRELEQEQLEPQEMFTRAEIAAVGRPKQ